MDLASRIDLNDAESFPSRRSEDWKYTDVRRFLRAAPEPSPEGVTKGIMDRDRIAALIANDGWA